MISLGNCKVQKIDIAGGKLNGSEETESKKKKDLIETSCYESSSSCK